FLAGRDRASGWEGVRGAAVKARTETRQPIPTERQTVGSQSCLSASDYRSFCYSDFPTRFCV
ncbi:hypothetical protein UPYG_G00001270, partial [Umbra pygmaea]